ncbi:glycosyltransferase family 2 protein [Methylosinus sp. Sm6]|uniref:glycosyltransferase family 2 protein n=1 Tax=Methylosinus sp. Sm6 TaxID=2866948 RepID=UPI001C9A0AB4|nr:glycosyltransferase family A protein [Methylosinus sp. Sm6]MBY6241984.1 glycosyltransferase family 2 protein [Methylosinus sp. Sm6]
MAQRTYLGDRVAGGHPTLSLIVCTIGRVEPLVRLFASLLEQTSADFEIVLVDQNPPGTLDVILASVVDRLKILHVASPRGLSRARNAGLREAAGALVCFPDDDCWYAPHLVEEVIGRFAREPGLDLLMGRTVDAAGTNSLGLFLGHSAPVDRRNVWFAGNSNGLFLRAEVAKRIGGFDEALGVGADTPFRSGEETDYVLRALALGAKCWFHHDLTVFHDQAPDRNSAAISRARAYAPGFGRVLRLHYDASYLAERLLRTLARAILSALSFDLSTAHYKLVWGLGTLKGYLSPCAGEGTRLPGRR